MSLDNALWLVGVFAELLVVAMVVYRRMYRLIPVFCLFCVWSLFSDSVNYPLHRLSENDYLRVYLVETSIDSCLQLAVLIELAWSVLRPIRSSLPKATIFVVSGLILAIGAAIWPFSSVHAADLSSMGQQLMHLLQTISILRVIFFLALAGCSQLLSIGWRDRELQVATGLGIYSLVSLGVAMFHTHDANSVVNSQLNLIVVGSYICSMLYWVISFARKEPERREFTPQMQNLLLAMAGVARADRTALTRNSVTDEQRHRDR